MWATVNDTELYQIARRNKLPAHPRNSRKELIQLIEDGEEGMELQGHPVDAWRDAIMAFVTDYWPKLRSQLQCPAKSKDPKACYGCLDTQVTACLIKNVGVENLIKERRR